MRVQTMNGLGDAIYHRPFLRGLQGKAWLDTRWPDLFSDFRFLQGEASGPLIRARYDVKALAMHNIIGAIGRFYPPPDPFVFDLPPFPSPDLSPYAVLRAPTLRADFYAPARNPKPVYIRRAAALLKRRGYVTVGVANVRSDQEWFDEAPPDVDIAHWHGELTIPTLMGLVAGAAVVVGGPGWTVPAALAYRVPHVLVYGGFGTANRLEKLTDPRIDASRLVAIEPDRFCMCRHSVVHDCDKHISDFDERFLHALDRALRLRRADIPYGRGLRPADARVHSQ